MPSLASYVPAAPVPVEEEVVYQEPVAPDPATYTEPAPAPAPAPEYSGGGLAEYAETAAPIVENYTAAPANPPASFIPGSTYRPMSIQEEETQMQQAPVQPPQTNISALPAQTPVPVDPFSGIGDVAGTVRDAALDPNANILTKAKNVGTTLLDATGMPMQQTKNIEGQRVEDAILHGDPNKTTDLTAQGLIDHPENLNPAVLTTAFINEFEGMPDWVPSSTEQQILEYYNDPVEGEARQAKALERKKTEGVSAWYNEYMAGEGKTLETGGWWGMGQGMFRDAGADPSTFLSAGGTRALDVAETAARNAGHIGTASGLSAVNKGGNFVMDPLFEGAGSVLGKVSPWFRPGDKVAGEIGSAKVTEAVDTAVGSIYNANAPRTDVPWEPIPQEPLALNAGPNPAGMTQTIDPHFPAPTEPLPLPRGTNMGEMVTNEHVANQIRRDSVVETPKTPESPFPRNLIADTDPEGNNIIRWEDGRPPSFDEMNAARQTLIDTHPNDFVPAQYNHVQGQNTLMRGAMTQEEFMFDNWPTERQQAVVHQAKRDLTKSAGAKSAYLNVKKQKARAAAGERGIEFQAARLSKWQDMELQRVVDNIQRNANRDIANGKDPSWVQMEYGNKLAALSEALERSGFTQSFEAVIDGIPFRHYAGTDTIIKPRTVGSSDRVIPRINAFMQQDYTTGMARGQDTDGSITNLLNQMGVQPDPEYPQLFQKFVDMIQDPDSFNYGGTKWKERLADEVKRGIVTPERAKQLEGYVELRKYLSDVQKVYPGRGATAPKAAKMYTFGNDHHINMSLMKKLHQDFTTAADMPGGEPIVDIPTNAFAPDAEAPNNAFAGDGPVLSPEMRDYPSGVTFTTSRGSKYILMGDGSTVRDRAVGGGSPGPGGMQPQSAQTLFVNPQINKEILDEVNFGVPSRMQVKFTPEGGVQVWNLDMNRMTGEWGPENFSRYPSVGNSPLEVWGEGIVQGGGLKGKKKITEAHWGTEIKAVDGMTESTPPTPGTQGARVVPQKNGAFAIEVDGVRMGTARTRETAEKQLRALEEARGSSPSSRRGTAPAETVTDNPVVEKAREDTKKAPSPADDPRRFMAEYPTLTAQLDEAAAAKGKPGLIARMRQRSTNPKVETTRMHAMGAREEGARNPLYEGSGMPLGTELILDQIDETKPLMIDGTKVPMYTHIKQVTEELENFPAMVRRIDPKDKKGQRAIKEIRGRYQEVADAFEIADIASMTDVERRKLITSQVVADWQKANIKDPVAMRGLAGDVGRLVKNVVDFRRGVGLTNYLAAPRQILNQYVGNVWGLYMGKPSAVIDMFNMAELRRHVDNLHAEGRVNTPNTQLKNVMEGYGASAPNTYLTGGTRTYAGHEVQVEGALGKLRDFVAPKWLRDWVSGPDELAKGAVAGVTFRNGMRREVDALHQNAKITAGRMAGKRQGLEVVTARVDKLLPQALEKYRTPHFDRPQFTGEQLEKEILDMFRADVKRGTVNAESLRVYADRMKRDWNTVVNSEKQYAASEVKRVMFSWDNTKADDVIQNIFLYHYWATRAGFLYSKEMLKKPYLINMYMDSAEQIQMEAEKGNYPNWMKGFTRILNSPTGVALFMSPMDMIGTAFHLNEMQMGSNDEFGDDTLTALGQLKGMFPFVWNPALEMALTMSGAFGPGAAMPNNMTGLNRMTSFAADVVNAANYAGLLGDLGKDANGNPVPVAPRFFDDIILRVAGHFGMPVTNSLGSFEKETTVYLQERILAENGGMMDPVELNAIVADMYDRAKSGDVDPMLYDAQANALANSMQGPVWDAGGFMPEALRPVFGAVARYVSPVRMTARSQYGFDLQYGKDNILTEMDALGYNEFAIKEMKKSPFQTERRMALEVATNEFYSGGDTALAAANTQYKAIGKNTIGAPINVGGVQYSVADINAMGEGERWDLATDYLEEQGFTKKDLDALQEYRENVIAENPDVGGYIAFKDYAEGYPGGKEQFVDDAIKSSPSFAAYMALQGPANSPDFYDFATSKDAYMAMMGEKSSVYSAENTPDAGYIPGLPMGTNFITKYQADQEIYKATQSGENGFTEFVGDIQKDVDNIYYAQEWLNTNAPGYNAGDYLPKDIYNSMKAAGFTAPKPEDAAVAYEYFDWFSNNATSSDLSVEAFLDQRPSTGKAWEELPSPTTDAIAAQRGIETATADPVSREVLQSAGIQSTLTQNTVLRNGPGDANPAILSDLPMGFPLKEIYRGEDGWSQIYVPTAGGGYKIGWVPTAQLQPVA